MKIRTAEEARAWRAKLGSVTESLPDDVASENVELLDLWRKSTAYKAGSRIRWEGTAYKCRIDHASEEQFPPPLIPALWAAIDVSHYGTIDDPIPAARGMEYVYGLYYLDPEDGLVYLCERTGEPAGGKIILQYLPHELISQYFTATGV